MSPTTKRRPVPPPTSAAARSAKTATGSKGPAGSARARLAAQQAEAERRRRRLTLVIVPLAVVLVAVATLIVVRLTSNGSGDQSVGGADVIGKVTSVPASTLDQVGAGVVTAAPRSLNAPALTADGKPKVLYVGAEYCPYCAAERWAMVVALSRFGTFSNLGQTRSSSTDIYPSTATLTFHGASYRSDVISFTGTEIEDGEGKPLDNLTAEDQKLFDTYDAPPYTSSAGGIPFVDIGGKYAVYSATYDPQILQGKTHQQIADALADPSSPIAKSVDGAANAITAAICATTGNKPTAVCTSSGVQAAAKTLQ
ncbi:thiol-disulfide isomerase/thioredoxin [Friedmanniella endophytica]|uniref:Thiol-disulfide isomerase/thioredoxin n=1 Tax=Microlunatus kandeliicorticis TaxID=1759536 RepID=A0A7W3P4X9_9ACTN|nr:DUF929 family protein [Microlunatus kandeliicorticis]MBA8793378.1 thiol-disulfide isomerase/thioredoxin [Microlunatus kandeliicorticis]